jgi:diacylglycerol kinase (ATP)
MDKPASKTGITRLLSALRNSLEGVSFCYRNEAAFRQESIIFILLVPVLILLPVSPLLKLLLFTVNALVLIVELLNSAVEVIVDMVSPDYDKRAGLAKDMGSAAVLVSLVSAAVVWIYALSTLII